MINYRNVRVHSRTRKYRERTATGGLGLLHAFMDSNNWTFAANTCNYHTPPDFLPEE